LGCGSDPAEPIAPAAERVKFEAALSVPAGTETVQCKLVAMPADRGEMAVRRIDHRYTAGSHHFLLFRTELGEIPEGGELLIPCEEGDGSWMSDVRGVVYAAQEAEGGFRYPEGVGMSFQPGEVMLLQSHYLNTSTSALDARIDVELELTDPASLESEAGVLIFYNPQIVVPPSGAATATLSCPVASDIQLVFAASHMHKRGSLFEAVTDDAAATEAAGGSLYTTDVWAEPLPRVFPESPPLTIRAGSTISYTCHYDNPDAMTVVQGPSADANEMCMFVGSYWPRADDKLEWCYDGTTGMAGTASAEQTLGCLVACGQSDPECSAGCWQNACPNAPMKISQTRDCLFECIGSCLGGLGSSACASCMGGLCPEPYDELMAASCE
jgi:hypothetical protein